MSSYMNQNSRSKNDCLWVRTHSSVQKGLQEAKLYNPYGKLAVVTKNEHVYALCVHGLSCSVISNSL